MILPSPGTSLRGWPSLDEAREAARSGSGAGIRVAVIDSGVEQSHPRLAALKIRDSVGFEEVDGLVKTVENEGHDSYGHGTAVAGIIHEVAPEAEIGSFRVIDARTVSRTHLICAGVREAIDRGYHILNCSFGCRGLAKFILPHKEWADEAWLRGAHIVAACSNTDSREAEWPSHFASVIGVDLAETTSDDLFFRHDQLVSFSARGENVEVAWIGGGVQNQTGTSFAAPRVSGMIARILSVYPDIPPAMMHTILSSVSEPWHPGLNSDW
jgi:subtilisin family serine protease